MNDDHRVHRHAKLALARIRDHSISACDFPTLTLNFKLIPPLPQPSPTPPSHPTYCPLDFFLTLLPIVHIAYTLRVRHKAGGGVGLEGAIAVMNACILRRISEAELGGDVNAEPSDSFGAALLSLANGDETSTGGQGFSESKVKSGGGDWGLSRG